MQLFSLSVPVVLRLSFREPPWLLKQVVVVVEHQLQEVELLQHVRKLRLQHVEPLLHVVHHPHGRLRDPLQRHHPEGTSVDLIAISNDKFNY